MIYVYIILALVLFGGGCFVGYKWGSKAVKQVARTEDQAKAVVDDVKKVV